MSQFKNKKILIIIIIIIFAIIIYCIYNSNTKEFEILNQNEFNLEENSTEEVSVVQENKIVVYITGAVNNEGVYEIAINSRIADQTCPIMIQRLNDIFQRNPLISMGI